MTLDLRRYARARSSTAFYASPNAPFLCPAGLRGRRDLFAATTCPSLHSPPRLPTHTAHCTLRRCSWDRGCYTDMTPWTADAPATCLPCTIPIGIVFVSSDKFRGTCRSQRVQNIAWFVLRSASHHNYTMPAPQLPPRHGLTDHLPLLPPPGLPFHHSPTTPSAPAVPLRPRPLPHATTCCFWHHYSTGALPATTACFLRTPPPIPCRAVVGLFSHHAVCLARPPRRDATFAAVSGDYQSAPALLATRRQRFVTDLCAVPSPHTFSHPLCIPLNTIRLARRRGQGSSVAVFAPSTWCLYSVPSLPATAHTHTPRLLHTWHWLPARRQEDGLSLAATPSAAYARGGGGRTA